MTSFVDDFGNYLDYSGEDFGVTKQAATWHDFKIKGDISIDFTIPNTSKNRDTLGYYGPQQIDSPVFSSINFNVIRNGNLLMRGNIVIKTFSDNEIKAFFISGNSNWFSALKFNIKDMIWRDSYTVSFKDLASLVSATEGICFPLADWGYNGNKRSSAFYLRPDRNGTREPTSQEVFPCIFLHSVLDQVCRSGGIKLGGDLKDDPFFRKLIITPPGPAMVCSDQIVNKTNVQLTFSADQTPGVSSSLTFDNIVQRGELVRYESGRYYAPFEGTYKIEGKIVFNTPNNTNIYVIKGFANGSADENVGINTTGGSLRTINTWVNLLAGDYVYFYADLGGGGAPDLDSTTMVSIELEKHCKGSYYATCVDSGATVAGGYCIMRVIPSYILPSMNATDFIKFLCIYFGAVCSYDEHSKTLNIRKLDRMKREEAEDWSEYFVSAKTNLQTGVAQNNYIKMASSGEEGAMDYNQTSKSKYGGGVIISPYDAEEEKDLFSIPFSGSWDDRNKTNLSNGVFLPYIKFYEMEDGEAWTYTGVTNATQASFTVASGHPFEKGDVVRVYSDSDIYAGYGVVTQTTGTSVILEGVLYISNNTGTLVKQTISNSDGPPRLMVSHSTSHTNLGFTAQPIYIYAILREQDDPTAYAGSDLYDTLSTVMTGWFDKPQLNIGLDIYKDSCAIDQVGTKSYNMTVSERYHQVLENIYQNPRIEAYFLLPLDVFYNFDFTGFIRLETKDVTGYFFVQKIENYRDPSIPVKVELLYVD